MESELCSHGRSCMSVTESVLRSHGRSCYSVTESVLEMDGPLTYGTYDICPGPVFQCEFNCGVHCVIRLTIFGNFFVLYVCMYMCYTPFFIVNSVVTVIVSSRNYLLKIYDMVITRRHF